MLAVIVIMVDIIRLQAVIVYVNDKIYKLQFY